MTELDQMRYVTAHYAHLQGLRIVPLGVPFLVSAMWRAGWLHWWPATQGFGATGWFVLMLAAAVGMSYPIEAWYRAQFGDVRPLAGRGGAATLVLSFVVFLALGWLQESAGWTISAPLLFVGAALFRLALIQKGLRKHYLLPACACVAFALWHSPHASSSAMAIGRDLCIGLGLIVAGLGDDRVLRRLLRRTDSHGYAASI
jgi:hypothetical protein